MPRLVLVLVVLAIATAVGLWWRARNGRFTAVDPAVLAQAAAADDDASDAVTADQIGTPLGARATLLQLSSEVCAPCRRTHAVLAALADEQDGVVHADLDVAQHLDLVRRFDVLRTPTVLLLDPRGAVVGRMSGATDRHHALEALTHLPATQRSTP